MQEDNSRDHCFTPNIEEKSQLIIDEIADELAYNYLANSFGDDIFNHTHYKDILNQNLKIDSNINDETIGDIYNERKIQRRRCRNVLIIGAGASFDSYSGVPLGQQLVNSFEEIFVSKLKSIPFLEEKYENEKKEIVKLLKGDFDFENFLSLLSTFFVTQTALREEIKNHTGFRYSPSLFYEIVAHMLKHTFLDVVINFNFDEMLDQCIHEELGADNYHFVLSDGHTIKIEDILVEGRIKAPVYIKPHGTFSHKSSLRFTKRHYLDLPIDIQDMLEGLLSGYRGEGKEVERVNLICVGFDLASIEFNDILNGYLSPISRVYHFFFNNKDTDDKILADMKLKFENQLGSFVKKAIAHGLTLEDIYKPINIKNFNTQLIKPEIPVGEKKNILNESNDAIPVNELTTPLGELFSVLWRRTYLRFNDFNKPRSISRHEIISYLFYNKNLFTNFDKSWDNKVSDIQLRKNMRDYYEDSPKYFRDRVLVEVAIELLRNNGNVDIVEVLKGRTGLYFEKYLDTCRLYTNKIRLTHSIYDFLAEYSKDGSSKENIKDEAEFPSTKLTFRILPFTKDELITEVLKDIKDNFKKPINKYFAPMAKSISKDDINAKIKEETNNFFEWLENAINEYYLRNPLAISILCNLLRSELLSSKIRENLLSSYKMAVFNGLKWENKTNINPLIKKVKGMSNYSMLQELFRIFTKTNASSYFNIRSKKNDSRFRVWESFQMKNVLHTNLLLSNDFKYVFLTKNWDCLLSVFETGETIKGIIRENVLQVGFLDKLQKREIVLLCSFEAVEQIHLLRDEDFRKRHTENSFYVNKYEVKGKKVSLIERPVNNKDETDPEYKYRIEVLMQKHKEYLCSDIENEVTRKRIIDGLSVVFVPFWEHNQHCTIFLKSVESDNPILVNSSEGLILIKPNKNDIGIEVQGNEMKTDNEETKLIKDYNFLFEGGYHMYRKGFSNNLNPVRLGMKDISMAEKYIRRDIDKLLLFYFNVLCRGIMYQVQNASQMRYKPEFLVDDLVYHRSWSPDKYFERMQLFMSNLFIRVKKRKDEIITKTF
jgi:hypothetical protein